MIRSSLPSLEAFARIERHQKLYGDTAKMRARLGLHGDEVPEHAWDMNHDAGGSTTSGGRYGSHSRAYTQQEKEKK